MNPAPLKGRGTATNPVNRFQILEVEYDPADPDDERPSPRTKFYKDLSESLITMNDSPDIGFSAGLNAYRGCEHGCAYCYARPFHEYLGFSSGLDFETKIMVKTDAPAILRRELAAKKWQPQCIMMSGVTDCYQPAEKIFKLTRGCLEVLLEFRNPVGIVTKNHLITRDIDLLTELARFQCISANVSITSLKPELSRVLEPRAAMPEHRLDAVRQLSAAGIPVGVMVAPIIPGLTDIEVPAILNAAAAAGARRAHYTVVRLPYAVKDIFTNWLETHFPEKKNKVLGMIQDVRGGKLYDAKWGERMRGTGAYAEQIGELFRVARHRAGLDRDSTELSIDHFRRPGGVQLELL